MQPLLSAQNHQEQSVPFLFVFVLNGSTALSFSLNLRVDHVCFSPFHLFLSGSILVCVSSVDCSAQSRLRRHFMIIRLGVQDATGFAMICELGLVSMEREPSNQSSRRRSLRCGKLCMTLRWPIRIRLLDLRKAPLGSWAWHLLPDLERLCGLHFSLSRIEEIIR